MPSPTNHSEGNGNTGSSGHVQSAHNQNNTSAVNLNQVTQHGEDVVSSDQQTAIDAANNGKNNKNKFK